MRKILICLLLCACAATSQPQNLCQSQLSIPPNESWIKLDGSNMVKVPILSLDANWTYQHEFYPVYAANQSISGIFFGSELASSTVQIGTSNFSITNFLRGLNGTEGSTAMNLSRYMTVQLNSSGFGAFNVAGPSSGLCILNVIENNTSKTLASLPLIITKAEIDIDAPANLSAGSFLVTRIDMPNISKQDQYHYGAILVSEEYYDSASISASSDGTLSGTMFNLSTVSGSLVLPGDFKLSTELIMNLIMILPSNSAAALQESSESQADLYMITDSDWAPGTYILTCAVYSSKDSIIGMKQSTIEVI